LLVLGHPVIKLGQHAQFTDDFPIELHLVRGLPSAMFEQDKSSESPFFNLIKAY